MRCLLEEVRPLATPLSLSGVLEGGLVVMEMEVLLRVGRFVAVRPRYAVVMSVEAMRSEG